MGQGKGLQPGQRLPATALPQLSREARPRALLPGLQGHRGLRFRGFCFSIALPILQPKQQRPLGSPGVPAELWGSTQSLGCGGVHLSDIPNQWAKRRNSPASGLCQWPLPAALPALLSPGRKLEERQVPPWGESGCRSILRSSFLGFLCHFITHRPRQAPKNG